MKKRKKIRNSCALFKRDKNSIKGHSPRGFALVTVLLLGSLLLVMLVGLLSMSSEERERSRMSVEGEKGSGLVEVALAEVKAKLMDGGEVPYKGGVARASMTACPGLLEVRRYDELPNRGYQVGREAFMDPNSFFRKPFAREYEREEEGDWQPANPQWIALYSQKWYAPLCRYMTVEGEKVKDKNPDYNPQRVFDLNTADNPFRPGRLYFGGMRGEKAGMKNVVVGKERAHKKNRKAYRYRAGESSVERPLYVQWIPVYADARYGAVKPGGQSNPIVGRYAYWVDVENTKININEVKREWAKTALGELTGRADAEGAKRGGYFVQGEKRREETPRYELEVGQPRSYKLFREEVSDSQGVAFYYRANYGRVGERSRKREEDSYARRVFGWGIEPKGVMPPAIADSSVIDGRAFAGLEMDRSGVAEGGWMDRVWGSSGVEQNTLAEVGGILDPKVEERGAEKGRLAMRGLEKVLGQSLTIYGWEEERDPLGRPKLDINEILREGDRLFDRGRGLPRADHRGSALQQLLARTEDPRYYSAYYPGGYPSSGEGKSLIDSLKPFAGRVGSWAGRSQEEHEERYGEAIRDQMVVNMIEYGRGHEEAPYIDAERGIVGAKSMPYVGEVAIRARNGIWGLWEGFDPLAEPKLRAVAERDEGPFTWSFPGVAAFDAEDKEAWQALAQRIYDKLFKELVENNPIKGWSPNSPTRESIIINSEKTSILNNGKRLDDILSSVLIDGALAMVNPDPFEEERSGHKNREWEIEVDYAYFDPVTSIGGGEAWPGVITSENNYYGSSRMEAMVPDFYRANGREKRVVTEVIREDQYPPYFLPEGRNQVDHRGYFFNTYGDASHTLVYFRPGEGYLPGSLLGGDKEVHHHINTKLGGLKGGQGGGGDPGKRQLKSFFSIPRAAQPFRLLGWRIYQKKGNSHWLYHQVPLRHPGQVSPPRKFWEMTTKNANAGIVKQRVDKVNYPDLHSLSHFQQPQGPLLHFRDKEFFAEGALIMPFGLGLPTSYSRQWEEATLSERKDTSASWFSSQTMIEYVKHCQTLFKQMPQRLTIEMDLPEAEYLANLLRTNDKTQFNTLNLSLSDKGFYHYQEQPGLTYYRVLSGIEGYLYMPHAIVLRMLERIQKVWKIRTIINKRSKMADELIPTPNQYSTNYADRKVMLEEALSDLIYFIMLQVRLRDEGMHRGGGRTGRPQVATGRESEDSFLEGNALVERLVCIDPVLGHRTGNPDLKIRRDGKTYRGHFYGINGHPWRRYHYYFYHYDKDYLAQELGDMKRPEPDRCLTYHFRDPRRCDASLQHEPFDHRGGEGYSSFNREKLPLVGVSGSVLFDAVLSKGNAPPNLRGELGWSRVSDVEEDGLEVWPYLPGMNVNYSYGEGEEKRSVHERLDFRRGSFLTHSPRGRPMVSLGEIGLCHSGFLQRAIDLDRPPLASVPGVKRLGSPQYGPPLNMLLDLVTPSNFRDERGRYLQEKQWREGNYVAHSPENPRRGTWNVNCQLAHDQYLAVREGAHGVLSNESRDYLAEELEKVALHPVLVPNAVGERREKSVERIGESVLLDPYMSPLVRFRRGWEQWLGAIAGDYSVHRNLGRGVWNRPVEGEKGLRSVYALAQGTRGYTWYPYGVGKKRVRKQGAEREKSALVSFGDRRRESRAKLLTLGRGVRGKRGLAGHVSADGPALRKGGVNEEGAYNFVHRGGNVSLYDVTRYGLYPLVHHVSEVGYMGLGEVYTALNSRSATTRARGRFWGEKSLVDESVGGDGVLGGMSQAGFARNSAWVLSGNQMSTSANVFRVHVVTQSLRDRGGLSRRSQAEVEVKSKEQGARSKKKSSTTPISMASLGYMDESDEVLEEQWAQVVVARVPRRDTDGRILKNKHGAPQYDYRILEKQVLENVY